MTGARGRINKQERGLKVMKAGKADTENLNRRVPNAFVAGLAILALIMIGQWLQSGVHLNHDVSYFVHFDSWLLQGRKLGSDLIDGSLPMAWIVSMPAAVLVKLGLFAEPSALRLVFWFYFMISAALVILVLSKYEQAGQQRAYGWVVGFVLIFTLGPGFSFGQREHASVLLAMPYLAAASLRIHSGPNLGRPLALVIGLLAGVAFSIKPYFLAVPALIELLLFVRLGWRSLLRVECLALGLTVATYVAMTWLLIGDFVWQTIELSFDTYWAYESLSLHVLIERFYIVVQPALYGALVSLVTRTWTAQHSILLLAGLGYTISYFVQEKGFVYHAFPILVCSVVFLAVSVSFGFSRAWGRWRETRKPLWAMLTIAVVAAALPPAKQVHDGVVRWFFNYNIESGQTGRFRQAVIDAVNHFAPRRDQYFYAFSTHPFPGFPTASYTNADWSGTCSTQPFLPAFVRLDDVSDPQLRQRILQVADYQRRLVVDDFVHRPPTVVFAERSRTRLGMNGRVFDDVAFYSKDPRFQAIWRQYEEVPPLGPLRVFVRRADADRVP